MRVAFVVAMAENRVIGRDKQLPWRLPSELKYFKRVTMGKPIVMGRLTFESIGRPLPGRTNIVLTRQGDYAAEGVTVVNSWEAAVAASRQVVAGQDGEEVMVIGGEHVFRLAFPLVETIYLTLVHATLDGDAFFPEYDAGEWRETSREYHPATEADSYPYSIIVLERVDR